MKPFKITALIHSKSGYVIRGEVEGISFETDTIHSIAEISTKFGLPVATVLDLIKEPNNPHKYK